MQNSFSTTRSVLIVDDDPAVCALIVRILSDQGFACLSAFSAAQALDHLFQAPVDLLITDLNMPGASGLDLIGEVRKRDHFMPIFLVTGDASLVRDSADLLEVERVVLKPFRVSSFRDAVTDVFAET